jgi:hypothetical protein
MERFFTLAPMRVSFLVDSSRLELERVEKWTPRRADDEVQHHRGEERMVCSYAAAAYLQRIHALQGGARCDIGRAHARRAKWYRELVAENARQGAKTCLPYENVPAVGVCLDGFLFVISFLNLINESLN